MTKAEAIELLDNLIGMVEDNQENEYDAALKMAVEALKRTEKRTETHECDCISRQEVVESFTQLWDCVGEIADRDEWEDVCKTTANELPSAQPEIIHCYDCIYYDPEHIEKNGVRYEYEDMPKAAFDILGTGLVNSKYGINVGGRCCRDYNVGYSEDKRVFVLKTNYCGRAERRNDE